MLNYETPNTLANAIRQEASTRRGFAVVVEGVTDRRIFEGRLLHESCVFYDARGRENALGAADILAKETSIALVVIVDADFDRLEGRAPSHPFVFWTDGHDAEMMMLNTNVLNRVLGELGSQEKIAKITKLPPSSVVTDAQAQCLREMVLTRASILGAARFWSTRDTLNLDFKDLKFERWLDRKKWSADADVLVNMLREKNRTKGFTNAQIKAAIDAILVSVPTTHRCDLCQGHDVTQALAIGLHTALGNDTDLTAERLEQFLRAAFSLQDFVTTTLHQSLQAREQQRHPLQILR